MGRCVEGGEAEMAHDARAGLGRIATEERKIREVGVDQFAQREYERAARDLILARVAPAVEAGERLAKAGDPFGLDVGGVKCSRGEGVAACECEGEGSEKAGDLPVTESVSDRLVRLPFHNALTSNEQEQVIDAICGFPFN